MIFEKTKIQNCIIPIPENYKDCLELIDSDYYRCTGKHGCFVKYLKMIILDPSFACLFWFRLCHYKGWAYFLCKIMRRHYLFKYGLDINDKAKVGYGLYLGHPFGIFVAPTAVIGNNVNLSQLDIIGTTGQRAAQIGNNVWIGPSVIIAEKKKIGNNSSIGAGSIVVTNIEDNCMAFGNPAVPSFDSNGEMIKNPYPLPKECMCNS